MLTILILLSCSALLMAHYIAFSIFVHSKLDSLLIKRYNLEWNKELDALAKCNDSIQWWLRVEKYCVKL